MDHSLNPFIEQSVAMANTILRVLPPPSTDQPPGLALAALILAAARLISKAYPPDHPQRDEVADMFGKAFMGQLREFDLSNGRVRH